MVLRKVLRNASFIRTLFCEYTLYFFCAFLCDFLLFLLLLSPFFGILAGRQRAPEVAGRTHAGTAVLALPSPRALRFLWQPLLQSHERGVGECSAHVADAQPSHLLGWGPGPVIRRVWTLTCDRETRRSRPRNLPPRAGKLTRPVWPRSTHELVTHPTLVP